MIHRWDVNKTLLAFINTHPSVFIKSSLFKQRSTFIMH